MDMFFHGLDADPDAPGDLRIGEILDAVEQEDLSPPGGHGIDGRHHTPETLRSHQPAFWIRRGVHSALLKVIRRKRRARCTAPDTVNRKAADNVRKEVVKLRDFFFPGLFHNPHKCVLDNVLIVLVARPLGNCTETISPFEKSAPQLLINGYVAAH
jgi:hypothetical protein